MAKEITVARESGVNPVNSVKRGREVRITAWDRSHGIDTPEKKQRALERAASSRTRKNERERERIKNEIDTARPEFGNLFVRVPGGGSIAMQPMNDGKAYSVFRVTKGGNTGGWERYTDEKKAVAAQKRMYEKELAKVRKRYNL